MVLSPEDRVIWLRERTAFAGLEEPALVEIAAALESRSLAAEQVLMAAGEAADGLYLLESGRLEHPVGTLQPQSFLPGALVNGRSLLLHQPIEKTLVTLTDCTLWVLPVGAFRELSERYPALLQLLSQQLAVELQQLSAQLAYEQDRQALLRPYWVTKARRGVIGKSRYGVRLRQQVRSAFNTCRTVLIFGEPGLEKDNLAALIHYGSEQRRQPIIQLDCGQLANGAELFGRGGEKLGLLEALGSGTLVLNNIHELPPDLVPAIARLLQHRTYQPVSRNPEAPIPEKTSPARFILIAERPMAALAAGIDSQIRVPPLRVRKADIGDYVTYYISLMSRARGLPKVTVTPEALRRLQAYDFPNNLRELEGLVTRALTQMNSGTALITEEILWPAQGKKQRFRLNLLNGYPWLRQFLRSPWWPDLLNYGFTLIAFAVVVVLLFWGPQTRDRNVALNLFWAWWWPLVLLSFPFVGRLWCAVCPFMIYGEVMQWLSLKLWPRSLQSWPRQTADRWGGWFLWGLFALILLWEELWNLENTAALSAWLLLLITAGAVICSQIFERRFWCRYLCPIGGMNGLFAKLSMTELRAQQGTCSAECTTYQCYKGGPEKGEGQETLGCPLYSHPAQLVDNRDCVLCMTCLKACPHRSVAVNLRPPGIELWTTHQPRMDEVALLFLLMNAVFLHRLPEVQARLAMALEMQNFWVHGWMAIALLSLPTLLPLLAHGALQLVCRLTGRGKTRPWVELAYGYLPLVLLATLAHYLHLGLTEAGTLLPVGAATFGRVGAQLPILVADPAVITFLQGTTLLAGIGLSILLTQKIARQPLWVLLPQHLCTLALGAAFWAVILPQG
ncbi:MAG: sigma 54-interacting transcriptional regulator [Cyanobacteria bacterium]|nr:sigma 54-interacting transcriptional regulator [Cyanobacteriota bacterium]